MVPTRDRPAMLATAVRSALAQRGVDLEVIVVDDASRDTRASGNPANDPRVHTCRHAHQRGVGAARNTGIATARGEWIALLDDDDAWAPDKLSRQLAAARASKRQWGYAGHVETDAALRILGGRPPPRPEQVTSDLRRHNAVPAGASNVLVAASLLATVGGFDERLTTHEDWDLWLRLAKTGLPAHVGEPLVALRLHDTNASLQMATMLAELPRIAGRHQIPVDRPAHLRWAAWTALQGGRRAQAVRWYLRAAAAGDAASAGRAVLAVAVPRLAARRVESRRPSGWAMAAEAWLEPLRR